MVNKQIMKRIILYLAISLFVVPAKAQHITYADFMKLVKIEQWSELNNTVNAKGYKFAGSQKYNENTDSAFLKAVWCKNCTYNFITERYTWNNGVLPCLLIVYNYKANTQYNVILTGKPAFTTFVNTAKANGFKFIGDGMFSDCISVWYKRINNQKNYEEWFRFNEMTDKYELYYWIEPSPQNNPSTSSSSTTTSSAEQNRKNSSTNVSIYQEPIEIEPSFPGGQTALLNWLSSQVHYPPEAEKKGIQGKSVVSYVVETDGSISNVQIVNSVSPEIDAEAVRVVKSMPKWTPGYQNGTPVRIKYNLPINFTLEDKGEKSE